MQKASARFHHIPPLPKGITSKLLQATGIPCFFAVTAKLWQSATVPAMSPPLEEDLFYTQVSANGLHSVLLSDGQAVACGHHGDGRCDIPPLQEGMSYTQVSAGHEHTVLLRSDGSALAFGKNEDGQCNIPALEDGVSYIQIAAGKFHIALLRSDGQAVACGHNGSKQCNIPSLKSWSEWWSGAPATCRYVSDYSQPLGINRVFQLNWNERFERCNPTHMFQCSWGGGGVQKITKVWTWTVWAQKVVSHPIVVLYFYHLLPIL